MFFGPKVKEMTVADLKAMIDNKEPYKLIDVREPYEAQESEMGGELIPLGNVLAQHEKFDADVKVIVHCRSGARSAKAIAELEKRFGYDNLYNLKGGILAWAK